MLVQVAIRPELTEHLVTTGDIGMPRAWLQERFPEVRPVSPALIAQSEWAMPAVAVLLAGNPTETAALGAARRQQGGMLKLWHGILSWMGVQMMVSACYAVVIMVLCARLDCLFIFAASRFNGGHGRALVVCARAQ